MWFEPRTLRAMLLLYSLLALASWGAGRYTLSKNPLRLQINAWWLIFPVVSLSQFLYPLGPVLLWLLIAALAVRELSAHYPGPRWHLVGPCLAVMALQTGLALHDPWLANMTLAALLLAQATRYAVQRTPAQLLLLLFVLLSWGLGFIARLLEAQKPGGQHLDWYFFLFVLTALNDIAQFIGGKTLGRHKIAARISPNKTWQGLLSGVICSLGVALGLGLYLQLASAPKLLALALVLSLGGFVGDLVFSAAKRALGIKDFSSLIPGHGGILDRVDSLVLTAPLLYLVLAL